MNVLDFVDKLTVLRHLLLEYNSNICPPSPYFPVSQVFSFKFSVFVTGDVYDVN